VRLLDLLDNFLHTCYNNSKMSGRKFRDAVILRAVEDQEFRGRLIHETDAVLKEQGIALPPGLKVTFVENTHDVIHIVIPPYVGE
jgi:hypothetical protein